MNKKNYIAYVVSVSAIARQREYHTCPIVAWRCFAAGGGEKCSGAGTVDDRDVDSVWEYTAADCMMMQQEQDQEETSLAKCDTWAHHHNIMQILVACEVVGPCDEQSFDFARPKESWHRELCFRLVEGSRAWKRKCHNLGIPVSDSTSVQDSQVLKRRYHRGGRGGIHSSWWIDGRILEYATQDTSTIELAGGNLLLLLFEKRVLITWDHKQSAYYCMSDRLTYVSYCQYWEVCSRVKEWVNRVVGFFAECGAFRKGA
jgi:hypothetical protein